MVFLDLSRKSSFAVARGRSGSVLRFDGETMRLTERRKGSLAV
jgi:hypothetical protein